MNGFCRKSVRPLFYGLNGKREAGERRHDDNFGIGLKRPGAGENLEPIQIGQPVIRQHQFKGLRRHSVESLGGVGRQHDIVAEAGQDLAHRQAQLVFIIDYENAGAHRTTGPSGTDCATPPEHAQAPSSARDAGSRIVKRAPPWASFWTSTSPP